MKRTWLVLLVGLIVVAAAFAVGVTGGHLGLDDWGYTGGCPFVRDGLTGGAVWRALTETGYGAIWMPVTFVSYMADMTLFGGGWHVHHAVNVALHLINVVLAFCLLRRLVRFFVEEDDSRASSRDPDVPARTAKRGNRVDIACVIAALLWAVHPMRAEAVTYVASRKEELWTLFALGGMLSYGRFLRVGSLPAYLLAFACFLLSAMSKPTAMCLPLLLATLCGLHRLRGTGPRVPAANAIFPLLPFFFGALALGILTLHSQAHPAGGELGLAEGCFLWRCLNAAVSSGLVFWYAAVPVGIHMDYRAVFDGWPVNGTLGLTVLALVLVGVIFLFARGGKRVRTLLCVAGAIFVFSLAPTLGVFGYVNGDQAMADRYTYFPHLALALVVAVALAHGLAGGARRRIAVFVLSALALCAEIAALLPVERAFESDAAMAARVLARDPNHWRALRVQGNALCARQNRTDEGVECLRRSLRLRPSQRTAESLAYVLAVRGRAADADEVRRLGAAVAAAPTRDAGGLMLEALGLVSMKAGEHARAVRYFSQALRAPARQHAADHTQLHLGQCLLKLGRVQDALVPLSRAARSGDADVAFRARAALRVLQVKSRRDKAAAKAEW